MTEIAKFKDNRIKNMEKEFKIEEINKKIGKEEISKEELKMLVDYYEIPSGACICQSKVDNRVLVDTTKCDDDDPDVHVWNTRTSCNDEFTEDIKDLCNGNWVRK